MWKADNYLDTVVFNLSLLNCITIPPTKKIKIRKDAIYAILTDLLKVEGSKINSIEC